MTGLYIALGVIAAFIAIILIRTALFVPKKLPEIKAEPVFVNAEKAASDLSEMLKCQTVSDRCRENENGAEFEKFEQLLKRLFPNVHKKCSLEHPTDRALLYKWQGINSNSPTVLMSHYDVVSVEYDKWEKPPFDGIIENGVLWGRGALDTKCTLNGALGAAEMLIAEGFTPKNDVYFAFAGDEEISGTGASSIVELFKSRGIEPGLVVDEGGAIISGIFPGVKEQCAVVGIAEKGMLNVEYSVHGGGGHSSAPARITPVGRLSRACLRVESKPFPYRLTKPAKQMFDTLGRKSTFLYRLIFSNLWLFGPVLSLIGKKSGGQINAMVRTTVAFTQMEGSQGVNVIPPEARMVSNLRLMAGDTTESALERLKKAVGDSKVDVKMISGNNPSRISKTDCDAYRRVESAIRENWQGVIVSPYLMTACSDSRHWSEISDKVYRFSPFAVTKEENATIHGNNERIALGNISKIVEFYVRLIKKS